MGWLITLGILALLAAIPLGVSLHYDAEGFVVKVVAAFVRIPIFPFPQKKKVEKPKKEKSPKPAKAAKPKASPPPKPVESDAQPKGGSLMDFIPLVKVGLGFLNAFRRKIRLNHLKLHLVLAEEDPADLAIHYGQAWAGLNNLLPRLERVFHIGSRDVEVGCDFTATEPLITAHLEITITLGRLLLLAAVYGFQGLREFLILNKKRKGGASV